jgi:acyl-CoA reductase-like NAD-dependent aldehyde dehydrogenase
MSGASDQNAQRLGVAKTYKFYVGGAFIRPESGRTYPVTTTIDSADAHHVNAPRASRKDLREAIRTAAGAWKGWSERTATNRGQILYRIAEMLEARRGELHAQLVRAGATATAADAEIDASIDRCVYYAGFSDKFQALLSSSNPTGGPHFVFTVPESMGVVAVVAPEEAPLLGLLTMVLPALVGGNVVVAVTSECRPLAGLVLGEILATSDVPAGVVNIVCGASAELASELAKHREVAGLHVASAEESVRAEVERLGAGSIKRVRTEGAGYATALAATTAQGLSAIERWLEAKTIWHPVAI